MDLRPWLRCRPGCRHSCGHDMAGGQGPIALVRRACSCGAVYCQGQRLPQGGCVRIISAEAAYMQASQGWQRL